MGIASVVLLAAVLATGAPSAPVPQDDDTKTPSDAERLSATAGMILGAASACDGIEKDRVLTAGEKLSVLVLSAADDEGELNAAKKLFDNNLAAGKNAVTAGVLDCGDAEQALGILERLGAEQ